jgi:hypothetical protein
MHYIGSALQVVMIRKYLRLATCWKIFSYLQLLVIDENAKYSDFRYTIIGCCVAVAVYLYCSVPLAFGMRRGNR